MRREFGRLDILVNNAGATKRGDFFELTDADWADGYALKFFAHVRLARAAWPLLKARKGSFVSIGGIGGKEARGRVHHRQLGQRRRRRLHQGLADIGKTDGVQVNCIHPSLVETERQWKRIRAEVAETGETRTRCASASSRRWASSATARSRTWPT